MVCEATGLFWCVTNLPSWLEGSYSPETFESKEQLKDLKYQQYQVCGRGRRMCVYGRGGGGACGMGRRLCVWHGEEAVCVAGGGGCVCGRGRRLCVAGGGGCVC